MKKNDPLCGKQLCEDYLTFNHVVEQLSQLPTLPVSIFGGSRFRGESVWYERAEQLGALLGRKNIPVMTGGGPGVMQAVSRGCARSGDDKMARFVFGISLKGCRACSEYLGMHAQMNYFFTRKQVLIRYAQAFIVFPGGYGTLDELAELLTLMQTRRRPTVPVLLIGHEFWGPLLHWLQDQVVGLGLISIDEAGFLYVTDSVEEAVDRVVSHGTYISPKQPLCGDGLEAL